jgi:hypothetical protein
MRTGNQEIRIYTQLSLLFHSGFNSWLMSFDCSDTGSWSLVGLREEQLDGTVPSRKPRKFTAAGAEFGPSRTFPISTPK